MKNYMLLYGNKKPEDLICIKNMFPIHMEINLGWTDFDFNHNKEIVKEIMNKNISQIIFLGLEVGWDKLIEYIKQTNKDIKVKVICNTSESLLYYDYERENFFKLLELSEKGIVDCIAFLKKGQYQVYKELGYKCIYLMQNYCKNGNNGSIKAQNDKINIGIYPLNYTWDKNIFNQLCIGKMVDKCVINYNKLDDRMADFVNTMGIDGNEDTIEKIDEEVITKKVIKNDINVSCAFTNYFNPVFFISMENGVPCIIGNTSDLFDKKEELKDYIVTKAEDNAIVNAELIDKCLNNKEIVMNLYKKWKEKYNRLANENIKAFLNE